MPAKGSFKPLSERYDITEDGCWIWNGGRTNMGYGQFHVNGKGIYAHRYFYEFFNSTRIPKGMDLDHLCRRPGCVNPNHLEVVTHRENIQRYYDTQVTYRNRTECSQGHPLNNDNVYVNPANGMQECKVCRRVRDKKRSVYRSKYDRY